LEKRVIVEVDGGQHDRQQLYDRRRDDWLRAEGFMVLRFWDHEVLKQVDDVKQAIWQAVSEPPP
jgi:very-short-patch-repair endonuclease